MAGKLTNDSDCYSESQSAPRDVGGVDPPQGQDSLSPDVDLIVSEECGDWYQVCVKEVNDEWPKCRFLSFPRYDENSDSFYALPVEMEEEGVINE